MFLYPDENAGAMRWRSNCCLSPKAGKRAGPLNWGRNQPDHKQSGCHHMATSSPSTIPGLLICQVGANGTHLGGVLETFLSKYPGTISPWHSQRGQSCEGKAALSALKQLRASVRSPGSGVCARTHLLSTHICIPSYGRTPAVPAPQDWAPFLHRTSASHDSGV